MDRKFKEYTIFDSVTPVTVTSSTDATPIVVTASSHGFTVGQKVLIVGHSTNVAANGIFLVKAATTNTFTLGDRYTNADVAGSGGGAGSGGICMKAPTVILIQDWRNVVISVFTSGTSTMTVKVAGSLGKIVNTSLTNLNVNEPLFAGTISASNPYQFVQIINLDTAAALNGATGIVLSGADTQTQYEVNVNLLKYFTVYPVTWSAGTITVKALVSDNL